MPNKKRLWKKATVTEALIYMCLGQGGKMWRKIVRMVPVATCERTVSGNLWLCGWCLWLHVNVMFQEVHDCADGVCGYMWMYCFRKSTIMWMVCVATCERTVSGNPQVSDPAGEGWHHQGGWRGQGGGGLNRCMTATPPPPPCSILPSHTDPHS